MYYITDMISENIKNRNHGRRLKWIREQECLQQ